MTEKQMRRLLFRVWYRWDKLEAALIEARNDDLIKYPDDMPGKSCCSLMWELRKAFEKFTKDQIAEITQRAIREQI